VLPGRTALHPIFLFNYQLVIALLQRFILCVLPYSSPITPSVTTDNIQFLHDTTTTTTVLTYIETERTLILAFVV
jgi:hypothetical protein